MNAVSRPRQAGAALAVSLIILIILTLLGIAAMRSSRVELRLAQNNESRMLALQTAQSLADTFANNTNTNLSVANGPGAIGCYIAIGKVPAGRSPDVATECGNASYTLAFPSGISNVDYGYAEIRRDAPEFVTVNTLRGAGASGRNYDFARFSVYGGYDNSGNGQGVAEVVQGTLKLHAKAAGVNYQ